MKVNDGNQGPKRPERRTEPSRARILPYEEGAKILPIGQDPKTVPEGKGPKIQPIGQNPRILPIGSDATIQPVAQPAKATPTRMERLDRVEISDAGRARASKLDPVSTGRADRIAEIRRRVLEGAYNADAVVADLARRILDRGDV